MNEGIAFDTHQFVKHLTESGFTEQQAEALATRTNVIRFQLGVICQNGFWCHSLCQQGSGSVPLKFAFP